MWQTLPEHVNECLNERINVSRCCQSARPALEFLPFEVLALSLQPHFYHFSFKARLVHPAPAKIIRNTKTPTHV